MILEASQSLSPIKLALLAVEEMQAKLEAVENAKKEPLAIIGMGCRFPGGANSPEAFWQLLRNGVDAVTEVPLLRWDIDAFYDPDPDAPGKMYTRYSGFISQIEEFDAQFFGISPREALSLDPQQRLLLEVSWEALENAAIQPNQLIDSRTGVFIGISSNDYLQRLLTREVAKIDSYLATGTNHSVAAGRLSYILGLTGPSLAVDTACSSSLVAVHLACQSLRNRECDLALAGGVNLLLSTEIYINLSKAQMLSADGRCKTFDAAADGYVRGEGCGVIVLKRLSDAIKDKDNILALIRGSAINQDGRSSGLTVPNGPSQQTVIRQALENGGVEPTQVSYIEAHGTGTSLGDPIEVRSLGAVFGKNRPLDQPLVLGSVKTNIGHLEPAAGIAGMIKVVLQMQHQEIAPHLHFHHPSPHISWEDLPFKVPTQRTHWQTGEKTRLAGVSAFSFSGTNAHVVLEQAPIPISAPVTAPVERPLHLLTLSAKTPSALEELANSYENYIQTHSDLPLRDICYTANTGREHFDHRLAIVVDSREQLVEQLAAFKAGKDTTGLIRSQTNKKPPKIAFLFTGQGCQYMNMGRQLYDSQPIFRQTIEQCNEILRSYLEDSLLDVLYPQELGKEVSSLLLDQTALTQPALFAFEYALYQVWKSWGIEPDAVMGHSVGEYVAATVAGVFSLEDGLKLIAHRGRLMQQLPAGGEMVSLIATPELVKSAIAPFHETVALAAINGPESVVISGSGEDIAAICQQLSAQGVKTKRLQVSHAFHSPLMTPMLAEFSALANQVTYNQPRIPLVSNVTGEIANSQLTKAEYWVNHVCQPVQFATSIETLHQLGLEVFLEIGPKPILLGMGRECQPASEGLWLPSVRPGVPEWQQLLSSLAQLYLGGVKVDWSGFDRDYLRTKVALPTYPFQRQRHWSENTPRQLQRQHDSTKLHPLIEKKVQSPLYKEILFETDFSTETLPFLIDHLIYNKVVVPGASHLSLLLGAANLTFAREACLLENIVFPQALVIPEDAVRKVQLVFSPEDNGKSFQLISFDTAIGSNTEVNQWQVHATGKISSSMNSSLEIISIPEIQARCTRQIAAGEIYQSLQQRQIQLGPTFQWLDCIWCGEGEALAQTRSPAIGDELDKYQLHPGLIDSCLQLASTLFSGDGTFVPFAIDSFRFYQRPHTQQLWCHALRPLENSNDDKLIANIKLFDASGELIAEIQGCEARKATRELLLHSLHQDVAEWLYEIDWLAVDKEQSAATPQGSWLIFTDPLGLGQQLAEQLQQQGASILVSAGVSYEEIDQHNYQIDPSQPQHWQKLLSSVSQHQISHIIHLWSQQERSQLENSLAVIEQEQILSCGSVLHLVQALVKANLETTPRLWLVTRGTQALSAAQQPVQLSGSSLWGLGRVIAQEHPELQCVCLDLSAQTTREDNLQALLLELAAPDAEDQIAIRQGKRYVARLSRCKAISSKQKQRAISSHQPVRLKLSEYGVLDHLFLESMTRRSPQVDEVEIQVQATGVNFRDVLNALGMLKEYYAEKLGIMQVSDLTFGLECAGIIVAVGENVSHLQVGDEVVGLITTHDAFSSFVTLPGATVVKKPAKLSFQEGATIPLAFLTAQYGLHHLAKIKPGERVLIHAAAGGVGQAAVQIALEAGAEVFATASVNKWEFLKSMGVKQIMNSRSLEFADQVMSLTQGQGVDIVLNSLNGDFIHKNLEVLAKNGRFVEIGKVGIWDESQVRTIRGDVSYFPFDLGEVNHSHPGLIFVMLQQLMEQFQQGLLKPLPQTVFPLSEVVDGFRYIATAKHIGKVVVSMPQISTKANEGQLSIQPDASYWITGGLGALGLEVAGWLVEKGARQLVLTGRSQVSLAAKQRISSFEQLGARVLIVKADVSQPNQMVEVLEKIQTQLSPLRGIIHAAGVFDDGVLQQQSIERFGRVMAPKVAGAWNLHNLTANLPLDFFVCFSSVASLLGSPGQGNYAAANAFMDTLAHYRQAMGLPGLTINWGPWSQVGMAASLESRDRTRIQTKGMAAIPVERGLVVLEQLLNQSANQVGVMPINWSQLIGTSALASPFFANLTQTMSKGIEQKAEFRTRLAAVNANQRMELLINHVRSQVAKVIGSNVSETIDLQQGFFELGMDSLTALELRNSLQKSLGCSLPSSVTFTYPTVAKLVDYLAKEVLLLDSGVKLNGESQTTDQEKVVTNEDVSQVSLSLVALQPSGSEPPLFCVHPVAGVVFPYYELAHLLGKKQPVYGLQSLGFRDKEEPFTKIEEMAAHYIKDLHAVQPTGPYHIIGWSFGALVAFEMAVQLEQAGEKVDLLAVIDTPPPSLNKIGSVFLALKFVFMSLLPYIWPYVYDYLEVSLASVHQSKPRNLVQKTGKKLWELTQTQFKSRHASRSELLMKSLETNVARLLRVIFKNFLAMGNYMPSVYADKIHLFRTSEKLWGDDQDNTLGWSHFAKGGVEIHQISGHHLNLLRTPNVQVLAEQLKACLNDVILKKRTGNSK